MKDVEFRVRYKGVSLNLHTVLNSKSFTLKGSENWKGE